MNVVAMSQPRDPEGDRRLSAWLDLLSSSLSLPLLAHPDNVLFDPMMVVQNSPSSQSTPASLPPSVFTLPHTAQLEALYTIIRDKETSRGDFLFYSDRIIRLLVEEGLNHLPVIPKTVVTPTVCIPIVL